MALVEAEIFPTLNHCDLEIPYHVVRCILEFIAHCPEKSVETPSTHEKQEAVKCKLPPIGQDVWEPRVCFYECQELADGGPARHRGCRGIVQGFHRLKLNFPVLILVEAECPHNMLIPPLLDPLSSFMRVLLCVWSSIC